MKYNSKIRKGAQSFWAPRVQRGLPQRVFADPTQRRASRLLYSMTALVLLVVGWFSVFAIALLTTQQSASALSDDVTWLKGHLAMPQSSLHNAAENSHSDDHSLHTRSSAIEGCVLAASSAKTDQREMRIYGVVPSELPFAINSLNSSCGAINVLMPAWYTFDVDDVDALVLKDVGEAAQEPLMHFAESGAGAVEVMPIVSFSPSIQKVLGSEAGQAGVSQKVSILGDHLSSYNFVSGVCFDLDGMLRDSDTEARMLFEVVSANLEKNQLQACVALADDTKPAVLEAANQSFDIVIVKGFQIPWVGSVPQPLSPDAFFDARINLFKEHVSSDKLIVAVGTFAVDWVSGKPTPSVRPYAEVMAALASADVKPVFEPEVGNSTAAFIDKNGLHHRVWMADVASATNHLRMIKEAGLEGVAFWGLGYEDPGIWAAVTQLATSNDFDPGSVSNILLDGYVSYTGAGPFVAPVSLPAIGKRELRIDPASGRVTSLEYKRLPEPSAVHLYGQAQPGQVVLTFDDGPHPEYTAQTLSILEEMDVPGSFFVLGHNALKSPELVERILSEGHELGSHTYWHPKMGDISETRARAEVNSVQKLINGITGREMRLYREPYMRSGGPISAREVASLLPLERAGYIIAGMDIVPRDWIDQSAEQLAKEIIAQVEEKGGGVVLLHDGGGDQSATVSALPLVINELRTRGYEFKSLASYLGTTADTLMPPADTYSSAFQWVSFSIVGHSWTILEFAFWIVLAIGAGRALLMLFLALRRKKHGVAPGSSKLTATIVIPAFNEGAVIARCLDHVLASDYPHFDVIVVDDGSSDETAEVARTYENDPRVTVLSQDNRGKAAALNTALDATESEILICIDADSQIHSKAITHLIGHFDDPEIGAVAGRVVVGNRTNLLTSLQALEYITAQSIDRRAKEYLNAVPVVPGAIGAWRTNAVLEAGIFSSETLTEDADMTMAIVRSDYRVIYEEKAVATTEAPAKVNDLMKQRLRWNLGMMQAGWKHAGAYSEKRALGVVSLTDLLLFGYLMPLLAPLADIFLVILLVGTALDLGGYSFTSTTGVPSYLLFAYLFLPALDLISAIVAFKMDPKENRYLLLLFLFQRILYRPLMYISVYRALWRACSGSLARWGNVGRVGYQFDQESVA